jgi:23S rRNA (cytosine1962-C5)-methyltransferase
VPEETPRAEWTGHAALEEELLGGEPPGGKLPDYELLDAGDGRRLERFGGHVVDRPSPGAFHRRLADLLTWRRADLRFDGVRGWFGADAASSEGSAPAPWTISIEGLALELRPTASGGLGVYPEHAANLAWVAARIAARGASPQDRHGLAPQVLNLFAHTGLVTLAAARAGADVAHVDASKSAVDWARRNAALSGLEDRPIRWLVDDAAGFVAREARRGRRYDGIVLDPPSFGRAGRRQWRLLDELPALLRACAAIASDDAFVLLTAHTAGLEGEVLSSALRSAFPRARPEAVELGLDAASGARLELGWAARVG